MYQLAPSILAADFNRLGEQLKMLAGTGTEWVHIDVMDGDFVPSISFGMPVIASIRKESKLFFDVHLMVTEPQRYVAEFVAAGADMLVVHVEACQDLLATINKIREHGCKVGVSINPNTSIDVLDAVMDKVDMILLMSVEPGFGGQSYIANTTLKIKALKQQVAKRNLHIDIEVDGGIGVNNVDEVLEAGANIIVAGSAVFNGDITKNIETFKAAFKRHADRGR